MKHHVWQTLAAALVGAILASGTARASDRTLHSAISIPASCAVTPVYGEDNWIAPDTPYVDAQPLFSNFAIVFSSQRWTRDLTYMPLSTGSNDIELHGSGVRIYGSHSGGKENFFGLFEGANGDFETLTFPTPGCWHLRLVSGASTGYITLWVQPRRA